MASVIAAIGKFLSNPEVLEKVCNVLPELAGNFKEIALSFPDLAKEAEKLNQQNLDAYNEMCKIVLDVLKKQIDLGEASDEEKRFLIDKMFEILRFQRDNIEKNQKHVADNLRLVGEFLLLGPFGVVPEILVQNKKKNALEEKK